MLLEFVRLNSVSKVVLYPPIEVDKTIKLVDNCIYKCILYPYKAF